MKSLSLYGDTVTDKAALSLTAALTTNTSFEYMDLSWTSTHPDTTLMKMAESIKKSNLRDLELTMHVPQSSEPSVDVKKAIVREWYQRVEVGGNEFILSLKDSHLGSFWLHVDTSSRNLESSIHVHDLQSQILMLLEGAATSVNSKRKMNYLPEIKFSI